MFNINRIGYIEYRFALPRSAGAVARLCCREGTLFWSNRGMVREESDASVAYSSRPVLLAGGNAHKGLKPMTHAAQGGISWTQLIRQVIRGFGCMAAVAQIAACGQNGSASASAKGACGERSFCSAVIEGEKR